MNCDLCFSNLENKPGCPVVDLGFTHYENCGHRICFNCQEPFAKDCGICIRQRYETVWIVFDKKYATVFGDEYLWLGAFKNQKDALHRAMDHAGVFDIKDYDNLDLNTVERVLEGKQISVRRVPLV